MRALVAAFIFSFCCSSFAASSCRGGLGGGLVSVLDFSSIPSSFPLLERYRAFVLEAGVEVSSSRVLASNLSLYRRSPYLQRKIKMASLVASGKVGRVRSLTPLESAAFEFYLANTDEWDTVEFQVYVLLKGSSRIGVFTTDFKSSVDTSPEVNRQIDSYLKEGYRLEMHLHNHPFFYKTEGLVNLGGELSPSGDAKDTGDIGFYWKESRARRLERVLISNGFETFEARARQLLSHWK